MGNDKRTNERTIPSTTRDNEEISRRGLFRSAATATTAAIGTSLLPGQTMAAQRGDTSSIPSSNAQHAGAATPTRQPWPYPIHYGKENSIRADVLILGGGVAGCHAAINAARRGAKVAVVDKGAVVRSGSGGAGVDHWHLACKNPHSKVTPVEMMETLDTAFGDGVLGYGEYGNGISAFIQCQESYDALLDVEKMGVPIRDDDDNFKGAEFRDERTKLMFCYDYENKHTIRMMGAHIKRALREELERLGVQVFDRVMVTSLLNEGGKTGGRVVGATGVNSRTGEFYIFQAKATVLSMAHPEGLWVFSRELNGAASSFWDPNNVGDGAAMAWEAGAELMMMDNIMQVLSAGGFMYPPYGTGNAHNTWFACTLVDANGKEVPWVDRDGRVLETVAERYRPARGQKLFLGVPFTPHEVQGPRPVPDLPERIKKGEFELPLFADLPAMPRDERRAIWGLHVGNEGKTRFPVYGIYTGAGFDPDLDMLQVNVLPPDKYNHNPWWMGMPPRQWRTLGGAGLVFDWDLRSTLPGLYGAGMQLAFAGDHASAATTGRYAGRKAAEYARVAAPPVVNREQVERVKTRSYAPINRNEGMGWKELRAGIARIMQDYCGEHRTHSTLKMGLEWLKSIEEGESATAHARNPHELMRTLESQSMLRVGKLVLHACMAAIESDKETVSKAKHTAVQWGAWLASVFGKELPPPEFITKLQREHYITIRRENGKIKTGRLPFKYWLKPPFAPTYEENYRKHASLDSQPARSKP